MISYAPKLLNIYVNISSTGLDENYIGRCLNGHFVNRPYYADDLVSFSSTASGMNELFRGCEEFSEKFGLKFDEQRTELLYFKPEILRTRLDTSVMMKDNVIKMECSYRYLGHMITDGFDNIQTYQSKYATAYFRLLFSQCEKKWLFPLLVVVLHLPIMVCKNIVRQHKQMHIAYYNVIRWLMGYHRFCSASEMFLGVGLTISMHE